MKAVLLPDDEDERLALEHEIGKALRIPRGNLLTEYQSDTLVEIVLDELLKVAEPIELTEETGDFGYSDERRWVSEWVKANA